MADPSRSHPTQSWLSFVASAAQLTSQCSVQQQQLDYAMTQSDAGCLPAPACPGRLLIRAKSALLARVSMLCSTHLLKAQLLYPHTYSPLTYPNLP